LTPDMGSGCNRLRRRKEALGIPTEPDRCFKGDRGARSLRVQRSCWSGGTETRRRAPRIASTGKARMPRSPGRKAGVFCCASAEGFCVIRQIGDVA
jgi:hypothetical protein